MERTKRNLPKKFAAAVLFILALGSQALAQVSIAPTSLFFSNQERFGSLNISNSSEQPQEVTISTDFGFPTSENGQLVIKHDSVLAKKKSIADKIKIFPQNFTLQPDQRQVVRFVARPEQNMDPGGYWSRVTISSSPASSDIEEVGANQVGAQINLVVNQVIGAHFRTPQATTSVEVTSVNFRQENGTGTISVDMKQTGNAPFIGSIGLTVSGSNGETVYQTNTTNSVYTTITRNFNIDLSDVQPGEYTITGSVEARRRDISQDKLLQIDPVSFQKQITIE